MNAQNRKSMKALRESLLWEPAQTVIITTVDDGISSGYHVQSNLGDWWIINGECGWSVTDTDPMDENKYCGEICKESTARKYFKMVEELYTCREDDDGFTF